MITGENPYAGQGPVLLDIGGDIGAVVVRMPAELAGTEVEIHPEGADAGGAHHGGAPHGQGHVPHVAVVARPLGDTVVHSLVFPEVRQGRYRLAPRGGGRGGLSVEVVGGRVSEAHWPAA